MVVDTIVMSNLGYFQLKANPGIWHLELAHDSRSMDLYEFLSSHQYSNVIYDDKIKGLKINIDNLMIGNDRRRPVIYVKKREGKEGEDILSDEGSQTSSYNLKPNYLIQNLLSFLKPKKQIYQQSSKYNNGESSDSTCLHKDDPVNIFTIASGHMYERLQKIMILSVLKNTRSCVKFWFIKNYMSPQMKTFLPYFSKEYHFDYDLITYKWPDWLHKQTEKQRVIWAYKILFLDVLFPLNIRKVLFLDSDQIIRTDIRELYDMDIGDAPLAYTPFCDNNKEMDGFRFWRTGFWEQHLKGKPYHMSALYVVDLKRFRQMAAGDKLRILYESLSQDPNRC